MKPTLVFCGVLVVCLSTLLKIAESEQTCTSEGVCSNLMIQVFPNGYTTNGKNISLFPTDCDIVTDLGQLLSPQLECGNPIDMTNEFCRVFSEFGTRITTCSELIDGQAVFLVPQDRVFLFPTFSVGHNVTLPHLRPVNNQPIILETISESPRVFHIHNFFSDAEASALVDFALSEQGDQFRLKRSSTGVSGYNVDSKRTSENAFDTGSPTSQLLKRRGFELLGISPYDETYADGIQVLRYNVSKAYISHLDWIDPPANSNHNWHSDAGGSNRFATILLYLSDVEEGGETVFPNAPPARHHPYPEFLNLDHAAASAELESRGLFVDLPERGWEKKMVVDCRTRLSVRPKKAHAILFYSQHPDGKVDKDSIHGGCPVLRGQKWAANLWVWNGPRSGYTGKDAAAAKAAATTPQAATVSFETYDVLGASLYWEDQLWGELVPNQVMRVNSFEGHRWYVKKEGNTIATWIVGNQTSQRFILRTSDI